MTWKYPYLIKQIQYDFWIQHIKIILNQLKNLNNKFGVDQLWYCLHHWGMRQLHTLMLTFLSKRSATLYTRNLLSWVILLLEAANVNHGRYFISDIPTLLLLPNLSVVKTSTSLSHSQRLGGKMKLNLRRLYVAGMSGSVNHQMLLKVASIDVSQGKRIVCKNRWVHQKSQYRLCTLPYFLSSSGNMQCWSHSQNLSHKLSISEEPWVEYPSAVAGHCTKIFPVAMGVWGGRKRRGSEILSVLEGTHPQRLQSPDRRHRLALWLWGLIHHLPSLIKHLSVTDAHTHANKLQKHKLHLLTYLINKRLAEGLMKSKGNWNLN